MISIGNEYFATREGRIFSSKSKRFIKQRVSHRGYCLVNLSIGGKCKTFSVHRLIAKAFIENSCNYTVVNHLDGNKLNNDASNLEWTSHAGNYNHAKEFGLLNIAKGGKTKHGRFTPEDIRAIRSLLKDKGYSQYKVSKIYNVTRSSIQQISNGKTYKHVV